MRHRLLVIAGALLIAASCAEERQDNIIPTPGKDVNLSANLNGNQTRTIYGDEESGTVKVNWVDGDLIKVYGTTCAQGRQSAEYKVNNTVTDATTGVETKLVQNFANELVKTGDAGVQWGDAETSDFYAVYPSTAAITPNGEAGVKVSGSIRKNQKNVFKFDDSKKTWVGTPYDTDIHTPSMPDAVMFACTPDVKNGSKVDLRFKPIATVLKFKLLGFDTSASLTSPTLQVQGITLTAPSNVKIAGGFGLDINRDGTISAQAASDATNTITIETIQEGGTYVTVEKDMPMEFNIFVIPQTGEKVTVDDKWSITVHTQNENFVVKNYKYTFGKSAENKNSTLTAGLIHKLTVPKATIEETATFDSSRWIEQVPRNVYLSELSVPGSWYSLDGNYQATTDLAEQYKKGIRAFHIDCRLSHGRFSQTLYLCCAGQDKFTGITSKIDENSYVIDKLKTIASQIQPQEYVVVVLTIAEQPKVSSGIVYGEVTPTNVLSEIASMLSENASALKLYTNTITSNTTVNDVLGKMIVKVNVNTSDSKFLSYSSTPNTLISEASLASEDKYITGDIVRGSFNQMQTAQMYWNKSASDLTYYYHQAQRTTNSGTVTGVPTIDERKDAIKSIITQSSGIYQNGTHNGWFQLGIGGFIKNSSGGENHAAVATSLNEYLLKAINAKMDTDPSPVGIVLMNYCTDDATNGTNGKGQALVNAIIKMNGKFRLNRNPENPEWPNENTSDPTSDSKVNNGGNAFDTFSTKATTTYSEDAGNGWVRVK